MAEMIKLSAPPIQKIFGVGINIVLFSNTEEWLEAIKLSAPPIQKIIGVGFNLMLFSNTEEWRQRRLDSLLAIIQTASENATAKKMLFSSPNH